jgi:hypothetical protein
VRVPEVDPVELSVELGQLAHHGPLPRPSRLPTVVAGHPLAAEADAAWLRMRPGSGLHLRMLARDMRPGVFGLRVLIGDYRPAILDRQHVLVGGHDRPLRLVRLSQATFTDPPEPVGVAHLGDHRPVAERSQLWSQPRRVRAITRALFAVAHGTLGQVNRLSSAKSGRISPDVRRGLYVGVVWGNGRVDMLAFALDRVGLVVVGSAP